MKSRIVTSLGIDAHDEVISPAMAQLLQQRLPRCSPRFLQVSGTLWTLVVNDSHRTATQATLSQFLDVMTWRAHDKITAEEFSVLYAEWIQHAGSVLDGYKSSSASVSVQKSHVKHRHLLSLNIFRALLLEKKFSEADLDLFVGLLLNEVNMKLLHSTITYQSTGKHSLAVVTPQWLALSEELFFAIDLPGTQKFLTCYRSFFHNLFT